MASGILRILKSKKPALTLGVLLLVAVAADASYYFGVCRPTETELARLDTQISQVRQMTTLTQADIDSYEHFMEGRKSLEKFKAKLASRAEYADVIKNVYTLAKKDGMKGSSFGADTSAVRQVGGVEEINFNMPISGSYRNIRKFIYDVESSDMFLNIESLGLASTGEGDITLTIGISTYMRS